VKRRMVRTIVAAAAVLALAPAAPAQMAQEIVDMDAVERIRVEGLENSQMEELAGYLMDVIGPRLTNSPGMTRANEWTAEMLEEWGLTNVQIEPWGEFGRGWERVSYSGRILTPFVQPLVAQPSGWTGSTPGLLAGPAVIIEADSVLDLEKYRGQLAGAWLLSRPPVEMSPDWDPSPLRTPLEDLLGPAEEQEGRPQRDPAERERRIAEYRRMREVRVAMNEFLADEGIAGFLVPSSREYTLIRGGGSGAGRDAANPEPLPELNVSGEQYNQMYRNVKRGIPVEVEIDIQNQFFSDDLQSYNTLGDIPGSDLADEYVMIGAHLDSWHYGTGATDDGSGTVVMMEAMRILKALDLQPRRTIRIALWAGEEQGLLGSRGWVDKHPDLHPKVSAYLNVDNGTGRLRGIWDQSNEAAIPVFEQTLWPFRDLGVVAVKHGDTGGTDHLSFDAAGIPGFNFIQDPIEYGTITHHTAADTYERLMIDDLKQAAVVVAATAYHLAMRDEMMPRKPVETPTTD
jgi:carboxypeptidase Q